ncbi:hypothetical protein [Chroococcidiopsis sp. TS-821]|uniref:hypothetical protein n=1 Tax=Chroococcidiopsis sp. TS-821 TaxID=1378066 RepID=UPI000CEF4E22|nr:hypothetical protein [Chroococcidiopsis sp. TS-821]PPS43314.1 hypothetical protein B1A85_11470 [Chroococcidiopsis sp. TS-821]
MTEQEMVNWRRQQGAHIIYHHGRYWEEVVPGFYQPIHLMARLSTEEATRPTPWCWGFRAALDTKDAVTANGSVPVHLLSDVANYDLQSLPQKRRTHLRKCYKFVTIVQLTGPALLQQQGYEVFRSSLQRTKHKKPPSKATYLASLKNITPDKYRLVLAGLIGDKLGGYIDGYAVNGTAYMVNGYYATDALPTSIVTGLSYEFVQVCRRSGKIHEIVDGLHVRENATQDLPKKTMGFSVEYIPSKVWINSVMKNLVRWRYPHKYYRLTGQG